MDVEHILVWPPVPFLPLQYEKHHSKANEYNGLIEISDRHVWRRKCIPFSQPIAAAALLESERFHSRRHRGIAVPDLSVSLEI
jgi:hypothetical protein